VGSAGEALHEVLEAGGVIGDELCLDVGDLEVDGLLPAIHMFRLPPWLLVVLVKRLYVIVAALCTVPWLVEWNK
jgi:hypothetical protein